MANNEEILDEWAFDDEIDDDSEESPELDEYHKLKEEARKLAKDLRKTGRTPVPVIVTLRGEVKRADQLTIEEQEEEYVRCANDWLYCIETYFTIFDQTAGDGGEIVPFKLFDFQRILINDYIRHRYNVANKYRQAGISTATCAFLATYVMFSDDKQVAIVANKLETARDELMMDVVDFIESCPKFLQPKPSKKNTQRLKIYDNGCRLAAFSSKGLRGYTPTIMFWDEVAWTEKADKFWEATKPAFQTGGKVIFVSTPNGLDPVFYKSFILGRRKENMFNAVELWWFNDPRYNKDLCWFKNKGESNEIKIDDNNFSIKKRIKLHDEGWSAWSPWFDVQIRLANFDMRKINQEILCGFLGSGDNFIAEKYLKHIEENTIHEPIRKECANQYMHIFKEVNPKSQYLMILDVSTGYGEDNSSINILEVTPTVEERLVYRNGKAKKVKRDVYELDQSAEFLGKVIPSELGRIAYEYGMQYNEAYVIVDSTGGYGGQAVDTLTELGYANIHYSEITHKPTRALLESYIKKGTKQMPDGEMKEIDLLPGFYIGNNRGSVLRELQRVIHSKLLTIRSIRALDELKTFVTVAGTRVADHKRSFHDDSIIGLAIGAYVALFELKKFSGNTDRAKKTLDAMLAVNTKNAGKTEEEIAKISKEILVENRRRDPRVYNSPYNTYGWIFGAKKY